MVDILIMMAAIAIYKRKGLTMACHYLTDNGMTMEEALDAIDTYDKFEQAADDGTLWRKGPPGPKH